VREAADPGGPTRPEHLRHRRLGPPRRQLAAAGEVRPDGEEDRIQRADRAAVHEVDPQPGLEECQQRTHLEGAHGSTAAEHDMRSPGHHLMLPDGRRRHRPHHGSGRPVGRGDAPHRPPHRPMELDAAGAGSMCGDAGV
jgi:hypothetical protein